MLYFPRRKKFEQHNFQIIQKKKRARNKIKIGKKKNNNRTKPNQHHDIQTLPSILFIFVVKQTCFVFFLKLVLFLFSLPPKKGSFIDKS